MSDQPNEEKQALENVDDVEAQDTEETLEAEAPEVAEEPAVEAQDAPAEPKKSKTPAIALGVSILALLAAVGGSGYSLVLANQSAGQSGDLKAQIASLETQVAAIGNPGADIATIRTQLAAVEGAQQGVLATEQSLENLAANVTEQVNAVTANVAQTQTRLELIEGDRATEYLLSEVEYLLRIAQQRVSAGRDLATGLSLLEAADTALANSDDASLLPVRRAVKGEIAALRAVPKVDRTGVYLELAALAEQIDTLRMSPEQLGQAPELASSDDVMDDAVKTLSSFVTIRRREAPVEPMLSPTEASYVRQNLRLMMEQSQLALLDANQTTWEASIGRALDWSQRYFMADHSATQALVATLEPMKTLAIAPELPSIGESIEALRRVQQARIDTLTGGN